MVHTVTQEDEMGCGVACVAFAVGRGYRDAVGMLGLNKACTVGFNLKELKTALASYGLSYQSKHTNRIVKSKIYNDKTMIFIKRSERYPYGHYLIRHEGMWMDPWINLPFDKDISHARSGYRKRLPGQAQWVLYRN